jgi:hypothetical protein
MASRDDRSLRVLLTLLAAHTSFSATGDDSPGASPGVANVQVGGRNLR